MFKNSVLHVNISVSWYTTNHETQYSTDVEFLTLFQNGLLHVHLMFTCVSTFGPTKKACRRLCIMEWLIAIYVHSERYRSLDRQGYEYLLLGSLG